MSSGHNEWSQANERTFPVQIVTDYESHVSSFSPHFQSTCTDSREWKCIQETPRANFAKCVWLFSGMKSHLDSSNIFQTMSISQTLVPLNTHTGIHTYYSPYGTPGYFIGTIPFPSPLQISLWRTSWGFAKEKKVLSPPEARLTTCPPTHSLFQKWKEQAASYLVLSGSFCHRCAQAVLDPVSS